MHRNLNARIAESVYASRFPPGPQGGVVLDFGNAIKLECLAPFEVEETGEVVPFMPLPLRGDVVHDLGSKRAVAVRELGACERGECGCTDRPTGWRLTKPIVRAMLGWTDSRLYEFGRLIPGLISSSWELEYHTPIFMVEFFFSEDFVFAKRAVRRATRAARMRTRSQLRTSTHAASRRHYRRG